MLDGNTNLAGLVQHSRWKIGCRLLFVACVFVAAWVRSEVYQDSILIPENSFLIEVEHNFPAKSKSHRILLFVSESGVTRWSIIDGDRRIPRVRLRFLNWESHRISLSEREVLESSVVTGPFVVPYWCLTLLFTLISAYLLLAKPRPKTSPAKST